MSEDLWVQNIVVPTFAVQSDDPDMSFEVQQWITFRNSLKPCAFKSGIELWCEAMQQKVFEKSLLEMRQECDVYQRYILALHPNKRCKIAQNKVRIY